MFGESDKETRLRLRALELIEERGGKSGQNDFMRALAGAGSGLSLEQMEKERLAKGKEAAAAAAAAASSSSDAKDGADGQEASGEGKKSSRRQGEGIGMGSLLDLELIRKDMTKVYPIIYYTLKGLLDDWEKALAERTSEFHR